MSYTLYSILLQDFQLNINDGGDDNKTCVNSPNKYSQAVVLIQVTRTSIFLYNYQKWHCRLMLKFHV